MDIINKSKLWLRLSSHMTLKLKKRGFLVEWEKIESMILSILRLNCQLLSFSFQVNHSVIDNWIVKRQDLL